jgi:predicted Zn finger-like uncharacterized protein
MIVECPACATIFPVDPKKVPTGGIDARCSVCSEVFFVAPPKPEAEVIEPTVETIEPEAAVEDEESLVAEVVDSAPAVEMDIPSEIVAEAEVEPENGFEVEPEAAFEIEREPSFEEYGAAFGSEVQTRSEDDVEPGFASEPTFRPEVEAELEFTPEVEVEPELAPEVEAEPEVGAMATEEAETVFEGGETTFEMIHEAVEEPAEEFEAEAPAAGEDEMADAVAAETVGVSEEGSTGLEADYAGSEEVTEAVEDPLEGPTISAPVFGKRDPREKAQRLARVLVSDIILYNPDRHYSATETGRLKEEFEEEIHKSWSEYIEQVGEEVANTTPYFTDALNEILAKGEKIF